MSRQIEEISSEAKVAGAVVGIAIVLSAFATLIFGGSYVTGMQAEDVQRSFRDMLAPPPYIEVEQGNEVAVAAFSSEGSMVVTVAAQGGAIRLWDTHYGMSVSSGIKGFHRDVNFVAFSPNGLKVITCGRNGSIAVWDVNSGDLKKLEISEKYYRNVTLSPDGRYIVTAEDDGIQFWNTQSGELFRTLKGIRAPFTFSPDGRKIAAQGDDDSVHVFDSQSGKILRTMEGEGYSIYSIVFSSDGRKILGGGQGTVRIWDVESGKVLQTLDITWSKDDAITAAFSPDSNKILTTTRYGASAQIWDVVTGKKVRSISLGIFGGSIRNAAFSPDGRKVLTTGKTARIWNLEWQ